MSKRIALLLGLIASIGGQPAARTWSGLTIGPYDVGVWIVPLPDRLGRVAMWRPVERPSARQSLGAFADLVCGATPALGLCGSGLLAGMPDGAVAGGAAARLELHSGGGGTPLQRRHPVVLLLGSLGSRGGEFLSLAEALASHGYVVAEVLSASDAARRDFDVGAAEEAARRAIAAIERLGQEADTDTSRIGLVAWSFGGVPALLAASRDPRIVALVSLDSALRYKYGSDLVIEARVPLSEIRVSVYSLAAGVDNTVAKDERVLDALRVPAARRVVAQQRSHAEFSDHHGAWPTRLGTAELRQAFESRHRATFETVLDFLRVTLRR